MTLYLAYLIKHEDIDEGLTEAICFVSNYAVLDHRLIDT